ncbi:hypothetical protein CTA1_8274 [Colletotrichum tanaceti]|uniref:Uncharacterized protein n=1 Tax=Colletotrichum tanaceti TaxID=1306861 RepID=A0A4U6XKB0_9PEZI|nr:hypothetical protein CTA1_8274 [Colletotrichum tanaceti]
MAPVVDGALEVVHARGVGLGLCLLPEDGGVEQDVGDVVDHVVLDLDLVLLVHDLDVHARGRVVDGVVDVADAGDDPDEVLVLEGLAHELGHDAEAADLDLDVPVVNVVLHGGDEHAATLASGGSGASSGGGDGGGGGGDEVGGGVAHAERDGAGDAHEGVAGLLDHHAELGGVVDAVLVELDLVKGPLEGLDGGEAREHGDDEQQQPEGELDPHVAPRDELVLQGGVVEDDAEGQVGLGRRRRDVDGVLEQRRGRQPLDDLVAVDVAVDEGLVRHLVRVHAPDVELEEVGPLVHVVPRPLRLALVREPLREPAVVPELVEPAHREHVRDAPRRLVVQVRVHLVRARPEKLAVVLHHDVLALPLLVLGAAPRLLDHLGFGFVGGPVAPRGLEVGRVPELAGARRRVLDADRAVVVTAQQLGRVVGRLREHDAVVLRAHAEEEPVRDAGSRPALRDGGVGDDDLVHAVLDVDEVGLPRPGRRQGRRPLRHGLGDVVALDGALVDGRHAVVVRVRPEADGVLEGVAVHLDRQLELDGHRVGRVRRLDAGVVARPEPGDGHGRVLEVGLGHVGAELKGRHGDVAEAAVEARVAGVGELDGGRLEHRLLVGEEEVLDGGAGLERRHDGLVLAGAVDLVRVGDVAVVVQEPDGHGALAAAAAEVLDAELVSQHAEETRRGRHARVTRVEQVLGGVGQLLEPHAVLEHRVLLAQVVHVLEDVADRVARVAVVPRHGVVPAALAGPGQRHLEVERGRHRVAPVLLPGRRRRHGLPPKHVVLRRVVQHVEGLLLPPRQHRDARQVERRDEEAHQAALVPDFDRRPPERVLVHGPEHVPRVDLPRVGVDHVVGPQHLVPRLDKVARHVVPGHARAVHAQEDDEEPVERVVERRRVQRLVALVADKDVLGGLSIGRRVVGRVERRVDVLEPLLRQPPSPDVDGAHRVASRDLPRQEEVVLAHVARALAHLLGEDALRVHRHLQRLVEPEPVNVQHLDHHAREVRQLLVHRRHPLPQPVLHRRELGQLTPVVRVHPERLRVAKLVKVAVVAAPKHVVDLLRHLPSLFEVEPREVLARLVVLFRERPVEILPLRLVHHLHLLGLERRRRVEVVLEPDQVTQGGHGVVEDDVLKGRKKTVVQRVDEAGDVAAPPQLRARDVLLQHRAVGVVVLRVAVDEPVEHEGVEREPPVRRRRVVLVALPRPLVHDRIRRILVLVEVVVDILLVVPETVDVARQEAQ